MGGPRGIPVCCSQDHASGTKAPGDKPAVLQKGGALAGRIRPGSRRPYNAGWHTAAWCLPMMVLGRQAVTAVAGDSDTGRQRQAPSSVICKGEALRITEWLLGH
ncbi:hypothetical protein NDU88_010296 [Pleurodeles waltl]|uniref:Uncharacterized protein n=1 Tax=Pleurodeles waltl TaxID=8319 RepID=A0AAV7PXI3_PLEWA|nr:hypothetical protein NDU88_010296 [Pleurodeles waltl]